MKQEWKVPLTKEKSSPGGFAVEGSGFGVQSLVGSRVYSINFKRCASSASARPYVGRKT